MINMFQNVCSAYKLLGEKKSLFVLYSFCKMVQILLSAIVTYCFSLIISKISAGILEEIEKYIFALIISYIARLLISYAQFYCKENVEKNVRVSIKRRIVCEFLRSDLKHEKRVDSAKATEIIYSDVNNITTLVFLFVDFLTTGVFAVLSGYIICKINLHVSIIYILFHIIWTFFSARNAKRVRDVNVELRKKTDEHFKLVRDILKNAKFIRSANSSIFHVKRYSINLESVKEATISRDRRVWFVSFINNIFEYAWIIVLLCISVHGTQRSEIDGTMLILLLSYAGKFSQSVLSMLNQFAQIQQVLVAVERVLEIICFDSPADRVVSRHELPTSITSISFKNIEYTYSGTNQPAIRALNKDVVTNFLMVVGANGCGKTTLLNLLTGNLNLQKGDILFNNVSISSISSYVMHQEIAYSMQDEPLFDMTIRENILASMADQPVTIEEIYSVCKKIGLYEDIIALPDGLDTKISEMRLFSAGQKRKIQLVRTFLRPSKVIVLDEPLMGLDSFSRELVAKYLAELSQEKFVIVATHRPEYFCMCTDIIEL